MTFALPYRVLPYFITHLHEHEIFVFGSNAQGFHGAGAAGMAMRGDSRNNWRNDPAFLRAIQAPEGHPHRTGRWAIYGVARGGMIGKEGKSYAVQTIQHPGARRSLPLSDIESQLAKLILAARSRPQLRFLVTPLGEGLAGYGRGEMTACWERALQGQTLPKNLDFIEIKTRENTALSHAG